MFDNVKIEISVSDWIKLFAVVASAMVFVISGYYFILNEIDAARNSPATPI